MHVLSVSSLKGGVGKTTIALGIASAAYARGLRTLVVDLDPQCDATTGLGAIGEYDTTVADVLKKPRHNIVHKAIVSTTWNKIQPSKLDVLAGSPSIQVNDDPAPHAKELWRLEVALSRVEDDYDLVIIDTPPSMNGLTKTAWVASDRILIVTEPSLFSVVAAERSTRAVNTMRKEVTRRLRLFGVIVNRYKPLSKEHQFRINELTEKYPGRLLPQMFEEKATLQQAQGAARPIHGWPGETGAALAGMFDEVLDRLLLDFNENPYDEEDERARRPRRQKRLLKAKRGKNLESLIGDQIEPISDIAATEAESKEN